MHRIRKGAVRVAVLIVAFIVVAALLMWVVDAFQKAHQDGQRQEKAEVQAQLLEPAIRAFHKATGRMPLSLLDRFPDGRSFASTLPDSNCLPNAFTGRRTEPRFFDRLHDKADKGTIAIVSENGRGYIVVYGSRETSALKIRI
ncbi:MAG: hypothetical protein WCV69_02950 [Patescibacteria group bacterium]|jgi:type II secretory pathway pseudopilin PulG